MQFGSPVVDLEQFCPTLIKNRDGACQKSVIVSEIIFCFFPSPNSCSWNLDSPFHTRLKLNPTIFQSSKYVRLLGPCNARVELGTLFSFTFNLRLFLKYKRNEAIRF